MPATPSAVPPSSKETLALAIQQGARPVFLSFPDWGGAPPLGWLAPWTPSPFQTAEGQFGSGEHHLMYGKAMLFGDEETAGKILRVKLPGQARELGRRVKGFREDTWATHRRAVLDRANLAKFEALPELRAYLLSTSPSVLVLASAIDTVWASGLDLEDPFMRAPERWPGLNLVGFSLMDVRDRLLGR